MNLAGEPGSVQRQGLVVVHLCRTRQPSLLTTKAGEKVDARIKTVRPRARAAGDRAYPGLLARGAWRIGAHVRHPQDRLPKVLKLARISGIDDANRYICDVYLPRHNARFLKPPALCESANEIADPALLREIVWSRRSGSWLATIGTRMPGIGLSFRTAGYELTTSWPRQGARVSGRGARRVPSSQAVDTV